MKINKSAIVLSSLMAFGATTQANNDITVINDSSVTVQAIWQAGGCARTTNDWTGDTQYTVCKKSEIAPGKRETESFGWATWDTSVKIFTKKQGRVGSCTSSESNAYVFVLDDEKDPSKVRTENDCP